MKHWITSVLQCANGTVIKGLESTSPQAFAIVSQPSLGKCLYNSLEHVNDLLTGLVSYGFLTVEITSSKMYLPNGKRFKWKNVKKISVPEDWDSEYTAGLSAVFGQNVDTTVCVKYVFWYIRKLIVDILVTNITARFGVRYVSVGSNNIDSDYDITLYGDTIDTANVIRAFNELFSTFFSTGSAELFDTNVYGVSFVSDGTKYKCASKSFDAIPGGPPSENPGIQTVWALIKFFKNLDTIQTEDDVLYDLLVSKVWSAKRSSNVKKLLVMAEKFVNANEPSQKVYESMIREFDETLTGDALANYISFINYNGTETYFSRGAFVDVVVNNQMCGTPVVLLTRYEYLDSVVENLSDFIVHYTKQKYVKRGYNAFKGLLSVSDTETVNTNPKRILDWLESIMVGQSQCENPGTIEFCQRFSLIARAVDAILETLEFVYSDVDVNNSISVFKNLALPFPNYQNSSSDFAVNEYVSRETENIIAGSPLRQRRLSDSRFEI